MFDSATPIDHHGTWCTQWDYVAGRFGAAGLLPFTISNMDFATTSCILDAVSQRLTYGVSGYSRWQNGAFLGVIAHWYASRFNSVIDLQAMVYGPPITYMAAETVRRWSSEGDDVVAHTPAHDVFCNTTTANRREVAPVPLTLADNQWHCDTTRLESASAEPKNTLLLLCSPHNPTGKVWRREELQTMSALCQEHGARVVGDEIHTDMVWDEHRHIPRSGVAQGPWASFIPGSKSFSISAFTGTYGFIPEADARDSYLQALKVRDGSSSPSVPALAAHIAAYRGGAPRFNALRDYLWANMRYAAATFNNAFPTLCWQPLEATYLAWIDLRPLNIDDYALRQALIAEQEVAIIPGYTYGPEGNDLLRLNVGYPREKLERGVEGPIVALRSLS